MTERERLKEMQKDISDALGKMHCIGHAARVLLNYFDEFVARPAEMRAELEKIVLWRTEAHTLLCRDYRIENAPTRLGEATQ